jgi:hypothetical protein
LFVDRGVGRPNSRDAARTPPIKTTHTRNVHSSVISRIDLDQLTVSDAVEEFSELGASVRAVEADLATPRGHGVPYPSSGDSTRANLLNDDETLGGDAALP